MYFNAFALFIALSLALDLWCSWGSNSTYQLLKSDDSGTISEKLYPKGQQVSEAKKKETVE